MKFKVLRGSHTEGGRRYSKGDIVDSASDLSKYNSPGATKFAKVAEAEPAVSATVSVVPPLAEPVSLEADGESYTRDELAGFSVAELREIAEDLEVDLGNVSKKADIISTILGE